MCNLYKREERSFKKITEVIKCKNGEYDVQNYKLVATKRENDTWKRKSLMPLSTTDLVIM